MNFITGEEDHTCIIEKGNDVLLDITSYICFYKGQQLLYNYIKDFDYELKENADTEYTNLYIQKIKVIIY